MVVPRVKATRACGRPSEPVITASPAVTVRLCATWSVTA